MNGKHLRREDRISIILHFLRVFCSVITGRLGFCADSLLSSHSHCRDQAADTDTHRAEIVYLVDLQHSIKLVATFKYFIYLVGSDCIQAATKGIELYQLQIVTLANELCGGIKP